MWIITSVGNYKLHVQIVFLIFVGQYNKVPEAKKCISLHCAQWTGGLCSACFVVPFNNVLPFWLTPNVYRQPSGVDPLISAPPSFHLHSINPWLPGNLPCSFIPSIYQQLCLAAPIPLILNGRRTECVRHSLTTFSIMNILLVCTNPWNLEKLWGQ